MKIGVIAGTKCDTQMGVDVVNKYGYCGIGKHMSESPQDQSNLQVLYPEKLEKIVESKLTEFRQNQIDKVIVYCNSLSIAVDMDKLSTKTGLKIITPLHIYQNLSPEYAALGVIAANNQSTRGIEKIIQNKNPQCDVIGVGILPLVAAIEKMIPPQQIVADFSLANLMLFFSSIKVEAVILGCTHFPYIAEELKKVSKIPIIDPAINMLKML